MKINISIEFDKEAASTFVAALREISDGIHHLHKFYDTSDWFIQCEDVKSTEDVPEPKPEQPKPGPKRKSKGKKTFRGTVLKIVKQNKDGISRKALQEKTGFTGKQVSNYVYQLKRMQKIEMTEDGLLKVI